MLHSLFYGSVSNIDVSLSHLQVDSFSLCDLSALLLRLTPHKLFSCRLQMVRVLGQIKSLSAMCHSHLKLLFEQLCPVFTSPSLISQWHFISAAVYVFFGCLFFPMYSTQFYVYFFKKRTTTDG